jgi:hypothetical protein
VAVTYSGDFFSARKTETKRKRGSIKLVEAVTGGRSSDNMKKRDSSARKKKGTSGEKWNITGTPSPHLPSRSPPKPGLGMVLRETQAGDRTSFGHRCEPRLCRRVIC